MTIENMKSHLSDAARNTFVSMLEKSPISARPVNALYDAFGDEYLADAELFCRMMRCRFVDVTQYDQSLSDYAEMTWQYARLAVEFMANPVYAAPSDCTPEDFAAENFYIHGLMWSYLFWYNHYKIRRFFVRNFLPEIKKNGRYLEIGAGHGLTLADTALSSRCAEIFCVERNAKALAFARDTVNILCPEEKSKVQYFTMDFRCFRSEAGVAMHAIAMIEVLEHSSNPMELLQCARAALTPEGVILATTVANVPFHDHVYQFHDADEIRALINSAGLRVKREFVEPTFGAPKSQHACNYTAVCGKQ